MATPHQEAVVCRIMELFKLLSIRQNSNVITRKREDGPSTASVSTRHVSISPGG